ncbi:hypothetical protein AZF37_05900 [endosymbiont 'TC1' of Trimyema compressum]|uniref:hypothetical protein n=1 Tax=endosymbiont 'TC1' of Trimyema compressum TaxID=243899 RepID=UPI0007F12DFE|nr:hypothetical protein [endosymbiont 'TC1' of Trimyema compressum]AMP20772.1 hypothetical protein AZF37_05900 [endosymbiont 'TC1' of Trimyema compressum]
MEIIKQTPLTILDGCITVESLEEVNKVLDGFSERKIVTVLAIPEDKDYLGVLKGVSEFSKDIVITYTENDYLKFSKNQVEESNKVIPVLFREKISEAIALGKSLLKSKEDILLFLGTQSFIRDVESLYGLDTLNV